jgi:hypothetical protein
MKMKLWTGGEEKATFLLEKVSQKLRRGKIVSHKGR